MKRRYNETDRTISGALMSRTITPFIRTVMVLVSLSLAGAARAESGPCGLYGAIYAPNPQPSLLSPSQPYIYRLTVRHLPDTSPNATFADAWVFQMYNSTGAHLLTTFSTEESCPNGGGLCQVSAQGNQATVSSNVVELTRQFATNVPTGQAPYAIVLSGFPAANWVFTKTSAEVKDMKFFTSDPIYPDLSQAISWVRISCGD